MKEKNDNKSLGVLGVVKPMETRILPSGETLKTLFFLQEAGITSEAETNSTLLRMLVVGDAVAKEIASKHQE